MSIQSEIDRIKGNVANAYSAVQEMGGTLPEEQNSGNLAAAVRGIPSGGEGAVPAGSNIPSGGIILWSGAADAVPAGWALCDGTNGTPDLVNRFVMGTGKESVYFALASQNQGQQSSKAAIALTPKQNIQSITVFYDVSSEARYDKFSIFRNEEPVVTDQSGVASGDITLSDLTTSDVLMFVYAKDASGDKNDDTAKFWMILSNGENVTAQTLNTLFTVAYPEAYQFAATSVTTGNTKYPGETGGADSVTLTADNLASHYHGEKLGVPGASGAQNWGYEKDEGDPIALDYYNVDGVYKVPADSPVGALITSNSGKNVPFSILPPYYTLCYIMKL